MADQIATSVRDRVWQAIEDALQEHGDCDIHAGLAWLTDEQQQLIARKAIKAMREPTSDQVDAALNQDGRWSINSIARIKAAYAAMIDAAVTDHAKPDTEGGT